MCMSFLFWSVWYKAVHKDKTFAGTKIQRNILPKEEKEAQFWWIYTEDFTKANEEEKSESWKVAEIFQEWLVGLWLFSVYFSYWFIIQADFSRQELGRDQLFRVVQLNRENWRDFTVSKL